MEHFILEIRAKGTKTRLNTGKDIKKKKKIVNEARYMHGEMNPTF